MMFLLPFDSLLNKSINLKENKNGFRFQNFLFFTLYIYLFQVQMKKVQDVK